MKLFVAEEDKAAEGLIPPAKPDGSGVGANYTEAYLKPMNATLEDGRKVTCRRKGLRITLTVGDQKGEALMRRIEHGPDVKNILGEALKTAAEGAGFGFSVDEGKIYLEA